LGDAVDGLVALATDEDTGGSKICDRIFGQLAAYIVAPNLFDDERQAGGAGFERGEAQLGNFFESRHDAVETDDDRQDRAVEIRRCVKDRRQCRTDLTEMYADGEIQISGGLINRKQSFVAEQVVPGHATEHHRGHADFVAR
jgi:hypothetical protein